MRQTSLAERPAAQPPAPRTPRKGQLHGACGFAVQASAEPQFFGGKSKKALLGASQQAFPGAIDKPQFGIVVEGEDGQVNFLQDGAQKSGGFQCAQALLPPRPRSEKSSSRKAARRFESVCREKTTRLRTEKAKPNQRETMKNVSVQAAPEE